MPRAVFRRIPQLHDRPRVVRDPIDGIEERLPRAGESNVRAELEGDGHPDDVTRARGACRGLIGAGISPIFNERGHTDRVLLGGEAPNRIPPIFS